MRSESSHALGQESRAQPSDHQALRLWLRLLSASSEIEAEIRKRLRSEFGVTLARFDYLAQLHRHPDGLRMKALSQGLMVTGGNITGLTNELLKEAWVLRRPDAQDKRSSTIALSALGRSQFERMAQVHEGWVAELFAGLSGADKTALHALLGKTRQQFLRNTPD